MSDFNPRSHLKKIKGKGDSTPIDYLPPKWRVKWFREEHPEGSIVTEIVHFDEKVAVVKCTITTPDGTVCVSHGHETIADHADYLMKAETKSIGRALAIRGYGIEFSEDDDKVEEADPRDYEYNQANTVQETTAGKRFRTRPDEDAKPQPPAEQPISDEMPDVTAAEIKAWFIRRLKTVTVKPKPTKEQITEKAQAIAKALRQGGLNDADRADAYQWLTGEVSGKEMTAEQLAILFKNTGKAALFQRCAVAQREARNEAA